MSEPDKNCINCTFCDISPQNTDVNGCLRGHWQLYSGDLTTHALRTKVTLAVACDDYRDYRRDYD